MDVGKAFTFVFEDRDWIAKIAIGGIILAVGILFSWLLLVPLIIASAIVFGYVLRVVRNVYNGEQYPLPAWTDFGDHLRRGLIALVGAVFWTLPVWILTFCYVFFAILAGALSGDADLSTGLMGLISTCFFCVVPILAILLSVFVYAPITNYAINNDPATFWDFGGNWRFISQNFGNYAIAWLMSVIVAALIAGFIGSITCGLGAPFATFWAYLVGGHLFAQVARAGMAPTDTSSSMMPPAEPPSGVQGPMEPSPTA